MPSKPWLRSISGLFINISAAWFATIFILPLSQALGKISLLQLTLNLVYGIVYLSLSAYLEQVIEHKSV